ncbi:MAG: class I SAM-dependent methyltransferase [Rhizobiaceae bacterium]|nr:class I SAM-dependent methyltransferase [Rhizobiaceae bacterium]
MPDENFFEIAYSVDSTDETRAMYDRWAKVYDRDLTDGEYQQPARCAEALKTQIGDLGSNILDVGCGTGLSGLALQNAGYTNIDGCDLSEGMLEKAASLEIYGRLFACDLNQPPLDVEDQSYDAITAVGIFSFGHVMPEAVDEFLRIIKPGGAIIIGLNDHFYEEGSLTAKLEELECAGKLKIVSREHGEHIPQNDLKGWVLSIFVPSQ